MKEAIELVLNFYTFTQGYWKSEIDECPEAKKFIAAGYTCMDEEYEDLCRLNPNGKCVLDEYINRISEDFIHFMCTNNLECRTDKIANWFDQSYELADIDLSEEICWYICANLYHYGYRASKAYSRRNGDFYILEKYPLEEISQ